LKKFNPNFSFKILCAANQTISCFQAKCYKTQNYPDKKFTGNVFELVSEEYISELKNKKQYESFILFFVFELRNVFFTYQFKNIASKFFYQDNFEFYNIWPGNMK
jgi:hypothetical protein